MPRKKIPNELTNLIGTSLDSNDANIVLNEVKEVLNLEYQLPPLVDNGLTYGDWGMFSVDKKTANDYRPNSALSIEIIEQMLKSAPVRFALEMKRAQIVSVFRNERSWKIECADEELRDVVTYNLQKILPKMALDFSFSSLAYGVSFQELVWERKSKFELGLEEEQTSDVKFIVAKVPNSINPATVDRIKRTLDGHFDGFVQKPRWIMGDKEIVIPKEASLIIPYEEKFRNLWGESILKPMYPIWYWYEVVLRAMVKYMERTGTPVAMVKAPARASILDPNTKKRYDGITWGMQIASNVARTNAIVIPSDKDEQGNPLWELSYLNSSERSQPFLDILELLTQMILRAGLSADRALSQSSGGVGSYSIGEIHKEATALHNELILTQWIHYLNTYFLPLYSLYNRGQSGPTVMIETQGLDPTDRTNLTTLLGVSQNMQSFQEVGNRIDWVSLLSVNNIPLLSQEEADEHKKKLEEESLKKQENMLDMQSKFSTPSPTKTEGGGLKANAGNKPAEKKENTEKLEDQVNLFNPYHDELGQFAETKGSPSKAMIASSKGYAEKKASGSLLGSIVKTTGLVLGIGTAGIVGLTVLGAVNDNITEQKNEEELQKELENSKARIDELSKNWPKFNNEQEATQYAINKLKGFGVSEIPDNVQVKFERSGQLNAVGQYDPNTNTLTVDPSYIEDVKNGDPSFMAVLVHELAHSEQEVSGQDPNWGNSDEMLPDESAGASGAKFVVGLDRRSAFLEGQNDLVTVMAISEMYGMPLDQEGIAKLSSDYKKEVSKYNMLESLNNKGTETGGAKVIGVSISGGSGADVPVTGYPEETKTWARLAVLGGEKAGVTPKQFLLDAHKYGFSQNESHQILVNLFPEEMRSNGYYTPSSNGVFGIGASKAKRKWPSQGELNAWMDSHGYVSKEKALEQILAGK